MSTILRLLNFYEMAALDPVTAVAGIASSAIGAAGSLAAGAQSQASAAAAAAAAQQGGQVAEAGAQAAYSADQYAAQGDLAAGQNAEALGVYQQGEYEQQAEQAFAMGQRSMEDEQRTEQYTMSTLIAKGAGGGVAATSPSTLNVARQIAGRGEYNALLALSQGEDQAAGLMGMGYAAKYQGDIAQYSSQWQALGAQYSGVGALYSGAGSLATGAGGAAQAMGVEAENTASMFKSLGGLVGSVGTAFGQTPIGGTTAGSTGFSVASPSSYGGDISNTAMSLFGDTGGTGAAVTAADVTGFAVGGV
jgi:hypothetical protein